MRKKSKSILAVRKQAELKNDLERWVDSGLQHIPYIRFDGHPISEKLGKYIQFSSIDFIGWDVKEQTVMLIEASNLYDAANPRYKESDPYGEHKGEIMDELTKLCLTAISLIRKQVHQSNIWRDEIALAETQDAGWGWLLLIVLETRKKSLQLIREFHDRLIERISFMIEFLGFEEIISGDLKKHIQVVSPELTHRLLPHLFPTPYNAPTP